MLSAKERTGTRTKKFARFVPIGPQKHYVHRSSKAGASILIYSKKATKKPTNVADFVLFDKQEFSTDG